MAKDNQCYWIVAGREGIHLPYFRKKHIAAVDYKSICDFDLTGLSKEQIRDKTKKEREECMELEKQDPKDRSCNPIDELWNISQIVEGDLIAVTKGRTAVEDFAIATSDYYFAEKEKDGKTVVTNNKHRVDVEYLDFSTTEIFSDSIKGIFRDAAGKIKGYLGQEIKGSNGLNDPMSGEPDSAECVKLKTKGYYKILERKRNMIFYGPPGTGKTWTARQLAECLCKENGGAFQADLASALQTQ